MTAPSPPAEDHPLRAMPRVDRLLAHPELRPAVESMGLAELTRLVRSALDEIRREVTEGNRPRAPSEDEAAEIVRDRAKLVRARVTPRVINATGVILHTNLGRAPLAPEAITALANPGYAAVEIDLATGKRGRRGAVAEDALVALTGAEAALVVNNGAAAVMLALAALAKDLDVIVSRGELVEIGGGFRVPEVLEASGARLVEVGTTNKTRASDYARALERSSGRGAVLRVHRGNFRMIGFVEQPSLEELSAVARTFDVPFIEDLGGGALFDFATGGLAGEPTVQASIRAGVDVVCFSTDKALGGPQGGVVAGKRELVERSRRLPLARALRAGRLPLAALEATLALYTRGRAADVPTIAAATATVEVVRARAQALLERLGERSGDRLGERLGEGAELVETTSEMGGGTFAGRTIPSIAIALDVGVPEDAAELLRASDPVVIGRIEDGRLLLDMRTVCDDEVEDLARLCAAVRKSIG